MFGVVVFVVLCGVWYLYQRNKERKTAFMLIEEHMQRGKTYKEAHEYVTKELKWRTSWFGK